MAVKVELTNGPTETSLWVYAWESFRWDYLQSFISPNNVPGYRFSTPWWFFTAVLTLATATALWVVRKV